MPKISPIMLLDMDRQPTIYFRTKTRIQSVPGLITKGYSLLAKHLGEQDACFSDMPYVCFHDISAEKLDVEVGFPVRETLPDKKETKSGFIPAGRRVICMFKGPYNEMEELYTELYAWIEENGLEASGITYEHYYNDKSFAEEDLLTRVVIPVKD